jgi:predicted dinucleotide-binding enzyme
MSALGIIGSGNIGAAIALLATAAGIPIVIANFRGPETLTDLVAELGPLATAGTVEQAADAEEIVVLSVPLTAATAIPTEALEGNTVVDTSNYYPFRDGRIPVLDAEELTTSELVQRHVAGARLVKAFSNILAHHIPALARPAGALDRTALPMAGNDAAAKAQVAGLADRLGFDTVDAGALSESWRFEPEAAAYTRLYLADPATPAEQMLEAASAPVTAATLASALEGAQRVRVAERTF